MSEDPQSSSPQTNELLQRILRAVEPATRSRGVEVACAIILALATTASAWCAYQSKIWGGAQMARSNTSIRASRQESVASLAALQSRVFDASMFITYMQARLGGDQRMESFLAQRFRPEMKVAVEAWFKLDPLNSPSAPPSPLHMAEYALKETAEASRQGAIAAEALRGAREARQFSDNYVLLTVLFASVLFFGGIARAFDSRAVRMVLAAVAVMLFMGTLMGLISMPVCHE
jgi:hypothetical protein